MAELVDAPDLGSGPVLGVGSSPTPRTTEIRFTDFGEQSNSKTIEQLINVAKNIYFTGIT